MKQLKRNTAFVVLVFALVALAVSSSAAAQRSKSKPAPVPKPAARPVAQPKPAASPEASIAKAWMSSLTLKKKIAQLIMVHSYGEARSSRSRDYRRFVSQIRDLGVGGVVVVNRVTATGVRSSEPFELASFLNRMQRLARIPLLAGADFERGASMRVSGTVKYPHMMAYGATGDPKFAYKLGAATAREARALGINWVFAPDADVNNNPDNPIINIRSFGGDPAEVSKYVSAFVEGAHSLPHARVLVSAKHFPGHGDVSTDTHIGMPRLDIDRARFDRIELAPFRAAIAAGADSVMTAHISAPALDPADVPSTISAPVLSGLLRKEMNYKGIIVTDAMDMQGLTKQYPAGEAAVRAIEAGVDVLLMPPNPEVAVKAIAEAVASGRISKARIDESVMRVLNAKVRVGLGRNKLVDIESIADIIESEESQQDADAVAAAAITMPVNKQNTVPLNAPAKACYYLLTESRYGQQGRRFQEELDPAVPGATAIQLDPKLPRTAIDEAAQKANGCESIVIAAFVTVSAFRGNVALPGDYPDLVNTLIATRKPVTLISLGNPYLYKAFPGVNAYIATYTTVPSAESAVLKVLTGKLQPTGRLVVDLGLSKN